MKVGVSSISGDPTGSENILFAYEHLQNEIA